MAKKKISPQKKVPGARLSARRKYLSAGALALITTLALGTVIGGWGNSLGAKKLRALVAAAPPPTPLPPPSNPSKEYIYVGGRLIATEEPPPLPVLAAPVNLTANTISSAVIDVTWTASPGADHYQIERTQNVGEPYTVISNAVTTTTFSDTALNVNDGAYLYRVRAVDSFGNVSPASNIDLATAVGFTDDPLQVGSTVKDLHVLQLRKAIAKIRFTANVPSITWTDSPIWGIPIKVIHIQELRTNLDEALIRLGLPTSPYTDLSLIGVRIKKVHIEELRQRVK